jgi:hypothetical protein
MLFVLTACAPDSGGADTEPSPGANAQGEIPVTPDASIDAPENTPYEPELTDAAKSEAFDAYVKLMEQISPAPGADMQLDMDIEMDIIVEAGGEIISMPVTGNYKIIAEGEDFRVAMVMDMGLLGGVTEMFYDGETLYFALNGVEIDLAALGIDADELLTEQMASAVNLPDFGADAIKSVETESALGVRRTVLVLDGNMFADYALAAAGGTVGDLGDMELSIEDMVLEFTADFDGNLTSFGIFMVMEMTAAGEHMKMEMDMRYTINSIGDGVVIAA